MREDESLDLPSTLTFRPEFGTKEEESLFAQLEYCFIGRNWPKSLESQKISIIEERYKKSMNIQCVSSSNYKQSVTNRKM